MKYSLVALLPKIVVMVFLVFLFNQLDSKAQIVINEIVSVNNNGLVDEDGDYPDWIELYNLTEAPINLSGFGISDNAEEPFKFILPEIEIPGSGYYLLYASDKNRPPIDGFTPKIWETIIREADSTRYIIPSSNISNSWIEPGFNDSDWLTAPFGFGYGDNDDNTEVPNGTISVFTRTSFSIEDTSVINGLMFHIDFDDGYIAYLNGVEISRFNITGDSPVSYDTQANDFITDPWLVRGEELPAIDLFEFKNVLTEGENILAIQVHNNSAQSSDMSLIPFLSVSRTTQPLQSRGVADQITIEQTGLSYPHLNFKLSSSGETLYLTNPDSILIDERTFPLLIAGESYGRSKESDSLFYIFKNPTPLAENASEGFSFRLPEPQTNILGGFYQSGAELSIIGEVPGDQVYFTTDGSDPTVESEIFGVNSRTVNSTTTFKLRSIADGSLSSKVITKTYFINAEHDLPVISISTHPDNLWSDESGIYVRGTNGIDDNGSFGPANWNQDWEIPIHIELYEPDGSLGFSIGAGAKIFGGWSRSEPQKSLSIFFRGSYGSSELNYKLFEEKDIDSFQAIVLRNSGNDMTSQGHSMLRDGLMTTLAKGNTELDVQAFRPSVLYLNGQYWGIHNIREKINEHFIESNSNADSDEIDLLEGNSLPIYGDATNYDELLALLASTDMSDPEEYQLVEDRIDIENYIDYVTSEIYYANTDWPGNNVKYWRDRRVNGKWRWVLYDTDFGFGLSYGGQTWHNTLEFALDPNGPVWPNPPWSTYFFRRMTSSPVFVTKFVNRMADLMNTSFQHNHVHHVIDSLSSKIESEIPGQLWKWGGSVEGWEGQLDVLKSFATNRPAAIESYIMSRFGVGTPSTIKVNTSEKSHGVVKVNRIIPDSFPWQGRYFSGVPIQITAIPKPGFKFAGWSDDPELNSSSRIITTGTTTYTANFEPAEGEVATIVINEIMYNDTEELDSGDWIELYNSAEYPIDLSGWVIKDEDDTHEFKFANGTELSADSYLVIAADLEAFNNRYALNSDLFGELGFNLAGSSDQVRLYNNSGVLVDSLQYQDEFPWDASADGTGFTLELKNSGMDNSRADSWSASTQPGGTPGTVNTVPVSNEKEELVPSEILLNQNYPNPFNPTTNITFQIPEQSRVNVTVFDMLGREVSVLIDESRSVGTHVVSWNASQFSSGVYFYRLKVGDQVQTRKMLLIK
ncbi:MAG: CotH kinase family protein [Balneola sp.]